MIERLKHMIRMWSQCHHCCLWCEFYDTCKYGEEEYDRGQEI